MSPPAKKLSPSPFLYVSPYPSLNNFQRNFTESLACGAHFQFHSHELFEKSIGIKSINIKQCLAGLSPRVILPVSSLSQKMSPPIIMLRCLQVWTALSLPPSLCEKSWEWGETPNQQPKIAHFLHKKNPPHQIAIFM